MQATWYDMSQRALRVYRIGFSLLTNVARSSASRRVCLTQPLGSKVLGIERLPTYHDQPRSYLYCLFIWLFFLLGAPAPFFPVSTRLWHRRRFHDWQRILHPVRVSCLDAQTKRFATQLQEIDMLKMCFKTSIALAISQSYSILTSRTINLLNKITAVNSYQQRPGSMLSWHGHGFDSWHHSLPAKTSIDFSGCT